MKIELSKAEPRLMRWPEVQKLTSKSRTTVDRDERAGLFPQRHHIGKNSVAWLSSEIEAWIANYAVGLK